MFYYPASPEEDFRREPVGRVWKTLDYLNRLQYPVANLARRLTDNRRHSFGDYMKASWDGLAGNERSSMSDVITNLGWKPTTVKGRIGKFALGLAADIFTDPLTYFGGPFALVGKAGKVGKIGKVAMRAKDFRNAAKITKAIYEASPELAKVATRLEPFVKSVVDKGAVATEFADMLKKATATNSQLNKAINFSRIKAPKMADTFHKQARLGQRALLQLSAPFVDGSIPLIRGKKVFEWMTRANETLKKMAMHTSSYKNALRNGGYAKDLAEAKFFLGPNSRIPLTKATLKPVWKALAKGQDAWQSTFNVARDSLKNPTRIFKSSNMEKGKKAYDWAETGYNELLSLIEKGARREADGSLPEGIKAILSKLKTAHSGYISKLKRDIRTNTMLDILSEHLSKADSYSKKIKKHASHFADDIDEYRKALNSGVDKVNIHDLLERKGESRYATGLMDSLKRRILEGVSTDNSYNLLGETDAMNLWKGLGESARNRLASKYMKDGVGIVADGIPLGDRTLSYLDQSMPNILRELADVKGLDLDGVWEVMQAEKELSSKRFHAANGFVKHMKGLYTDPATAQYLRNTIDDSAEDIIRNKAGLRFIRGLNSAIKGHLLARPGTWIRNTGSSFMMPFANGVNLFKYPLMLAKTGWNFATEKLGEKIPALKGLYNPNATVSIGGRKVKISDFARKLKEVGASTDLSSSMAIDKMPDEGVVRKVWNWIPRQISELNDWTENTFRTTYAMAKRHQGAGWDEIANGIANTFYDYSDLGQQEKLLQATLMPFYTFFRKNVGATGRYLVQHPSYVSLPVDARNVIEATAQPKDRINWQGRKWVNSPKRKYRLTPASLSNGRAIDFSYMFPQNDAVSVLNPLNALDSMFFNGIPMLAALRDVNENDNGLGNAIMPNGDDPKAKPKHSTIMGYPRTGRPWNALSYLVNTFPELRLLDNIIKAKINDSNPSFYEGKKVYPEPLKDVILSELIGGKIFKP